MAASSPSTRITRKTPVRRSRSFISNVTGSSARSLGIDGDTKQIDPIFDPKIIRSTTPLSEDVKSSSIKLRETMHVLSDASKLSENNLKITESGHVGSAELKNLSNQYRRVLEIIYGLRKTVEALKVQLNSIDAKRKQFEDSHVQMLLAQVNGDEEPFSEDSLIPFGC